MKKLVLVFAVMFAMVACTANKTTNSVSSDSTVVDTVMIDSVGE